MSFCPFPLHLSSKLKAGDISVSFFARQTSFLTSRLPANTNGDHSGGAGVTQQANNVTQRSFQEQGPLWSFLEGFETSSENANISLNTPYFQTVQKCIPLHSYY